MIPVIRIKRAYEKPLKKDGYRVLVDRLWPRGVEKEELELSEWAKDLAPSVHLRKWWGHDPAMWVEFQKQYRKELQHNRAVDNFVENHRDKKTITLVYGAKDVEHNHAIVLQQYMEQQYIS